MTRDQIALGLTISGGVILTLGGFLISAPVGLMVAGGYLAVTGYVVGQE